ncbi:hypothetical protein D7030_04370 [Flavobacteriaceae bacterium AU392]|nr:hypothetical protein D1817_10845 [Flavobacteriaceae bacterium]RKM85912.1 hypothetical protein D7030_04370 [Flavobacteriaceae bacterium AU392]
MQEGFNYLETGNYNAAESYFESVLKDYPDNRTAKLCYGRAVGLKGNSKKAISIFTELIKLYPEDFEIKLNYGEALLWNKSFDVAKAYYEDLVLEDNQSFPALLGYANTLSNLKLFDEALSYVNKALSVSPGNQNALISKKYIYLGYANQHIQNQKYANAEYLLNKNLTLFKNDKETLLNLANLYLISNDLEKATVVYETMGQKQEDIVISLNGLALVSHLKGKEKQALKTSLRAYNMMTSLSDKTLINQTKERYIQALIWNKKYKQASSLINELISEMPNENWVLALRATLYIYKSDFKKSLADYNTILQNDSASFDGNLGKANTLKALGLYNDAYKSAHTTLSFYNNQKDAVNFIKTLNTSFTPYLDTKAAYSFDNGDNNAFSFQTDIEVPIHTKFKLLANYSYRTTDNSNTNNEAIANNALLGVSYTLLPNLTFKSSFGVTSVEGETNNYTQFLTDITINIKPFKLQTLDIGYKREVQNFNADLLDLEIVQNNIYANYNISTNFNLGWFTQYYYTFQNDNNTRNLLFTSLYYNILNKPLLKTGINYQYITFKDQVPNIYFSPERFNATEVFLNLIKEEIITESRAWFYELTSAFGLQFIENNSQQGTFRFQGKLGYKISDRSLINLYGSYSNIASTTAAGFTFSEIGLRFKWYLTNAPIFIKKKGNK